jgi:hypothetical protein
LNVGVTGAFVVLAYAFAPVVVGLFIADAGVVALATRLLHIVVWSAVLLGIATILSGVMRASGTVLVPTALTVLAILCVEVPAAYLFNARIGLEGIWWSYFRCRSEARARGPAVSSEGCRRVRALMLAVEGLIFARTRPDSRRHFAPTI